MRVIGIGKVWLELKLFPSGVGRFVFSHFISESILSFVSSVILLINSVDGLGIFILDPDDLGGILDRHIHIDKFDQFCTLLVTNLIVLPSHKKLLLKSKYKVSKLTAI